MARRKAATNQDALIYILSERTRLRKLSEQTKSRNKFPPKAPPLAIQTATPLAALVKLSSRLKDQDATASQQKGSIPGKITIGHSGVTTGRVR